MLRSYKVEAVKVHHFVPCRYKVLYELLLGVLTGVNFRHGPQLGRGRAAFIVLNSIGLGLSRMYELICGNRMHRDMQVFYSVEDALEWLNREDRTRCHERGSESAMNGAGKDVT